jgi:Amidohydrolase family
VDDTVDMIEQMKACSFLQGVKHLDPTIMPPERCIEMATINAAKALGLDGESARSSRASSPTSLYSISRRRTPARRPTRSPALSSPRVGPTRIPCS